MQPPEAAASRAVSSGASREQLFPVIDLLHKVGGGLLRLNCGVREEAKLLLSFNARLLRRLNIIASTSQASSPDRLMGSVQLNC